jgi:primosomal protein N' (replication factor Y)
MHCLVLTHSKSPGINNGLTYDTADKNIKPGALVRVQLRKKSMEGLVLSTENELAGEKEYSLKPVEEVLSIEPIIGETQLKTMQWMSQYYCCSLRAALTPFLPSPPWKTLIPKDTIGYRFVRDPEKASKKQLTILDELRGKEWMSAQDLKRHTEASAATIKKLKENGCIEEESRNLRKETEETYALLGAIPSLTPVQQTAYEAIKADARPSLLFGITGSGKTEVYAKLIADAAAKGKQSILLVPEILLTEHTIRRFEKLFDREKIAMLHSRLTPASRRAEWMRIRSGEAALVIGSRSALFAPCRKLGVVIMDEEHEWTYKNEQTPRYHARETAEALCEFAGAKLVLGTATPSLETWARVKSGRYHMARLPERYNNNLLPTVKIIDLAEVKFGQLYPFSPTLLAAIQDRLNRKEQVVLFLNRRGVASAILCLKCRRRLVSPASQLPFTMHKNNFGRPYLLDHFSGMSVDLPANCPHCGAHDLLPIGAGTQKLEDIIAMQFPTARILRADSDTLQHPEEMRALLNTMHDRKADILFGTQSVVKGLDLPGVTLAAVMIADIGLSLPHFRAGERVFQLLTQLTGRSGRAQPGEVIIQTFRPDAAEVVAASQHRTEDYLEAELKLREQLHYPPSTEMIRFITRMEGAEACAKKLHASILRFITSEKIDAQAMVAPTLFGGGKIWHVLLRGQNLRSFLTKIDLTDTVVDIDPIDCI